MGQRGDLRLGLKAVILHHTTQNVPQCKSYELFLSGIFHLIFSDHGRPHGMETTETETIDKGLLLSKTAMALYVVKSSPFEKLKYLLDLWKKY